MDRAATLISLVLITALALSGTARAATPEQKCRKDVNKNVAKIYKEVLKRTAKCFKTRIKTPGDTTDCVDPAAFDSGGKVGDATTKLVDAMGASSSNCGALGSQYDAACTDAPTACSVACAVCATGGAVATCIACQVVELALVQVDGLYGSPPDLSADSDAQKCQNEIGKGASKYSRTRLKEQQKCQAFVSDDKLRVNCAGTDLKGKIAKAAGKSPAKIVKKCLTSPGVDQVPDLDGGAVCLGADTATAAGCVISTAGSAVDAIFALASKPAALRGFVMGLGPTGGLLPLPGVRIEIAGASLGAFTDNNGAYRLEGLPPGRQTIVIDGQRGGSYPRIPMGVIVPMVGEESLGIFTMPEIDMANAVDITSISTANPDGSRVLTSPLTLSNPGIPGATLDLQAGTLITFDVPNRAPLLSVSVVPFAVMPFPGGGVFSDEIFSFQPEGTTIAPAANVTFPNNTGLPNGATVDIYIPDFATNTFILPGTGTVTTGGTLVESDSPVVNRFDWHFAAPPPTGCFTTVIGTVVDSVSVPVVGADVLVAGATTVTDTGGTFSFADLSCLPAVRADASVLNQATGDINTGSNLVATVFSGTTDVGDIVLSANNCSNGVLDVPEECDDGNRVSADGCNAFCLLEECGNFVIDPGEECDGTVGCADFCTVCGDGILRIPGEECDAGVLNGQLGSGCNSFCETTVCGNGLLEEPEACDFGSANGGSLSFCQSDCSLKPSTQGGVSSLVRAFASCDSPNAATTPHSIDACQPPVIASTFQFGPNGAGDLSFDLVGGGTGAVISVSLADVRDAGGVPITDATNWRVTATVRVTLRASTTSLPDVTLEDIALNTPLALGSGGQLSGSGALSAASAVDLSAFGQHNVQILDVAVIDPNGDRFADPGFFIDAAPPLTANAPIQAEGGNMELARFFDACTVPNAVVNGVDACTPPTAPSDWTFASGGNASFTYQVSGDDLFLSASLNGVLDQTGAPADQVGSLAFTNRYTIADVGGEMTVVDAPFDVAATLTAGRGIVSTTADTEFTNLVGSPLLVARQVSLAAGVRGTMPGGLRLLKDGLTPIILDQNRNSFAQMGMRDSGP